MPLGSKWQGAKCECLWASTPGKEKLVKRLQVGRNWMYSRTSKRIMMAMGQEAKGQWSQVGFPAFSGGEFGFQSVLWDEAEE